VRVVARKAILSRPCGGLGGGVVGLRASTVQAARWMALRGNAVFSAAAALVQGGTQAASSGPSCAQRPIVFAPAKLGSTRPRSSTSSA